MKLFLVLSISIWGMILFSQTPDVDSHYQLIWEDNCNGTYVDTSRWKINDWFDGHAGFLYGFDSTTNDRPYPSVDLASNIDVSNGIMKMHYKSDSVSCGYEYNAWWNKSIQNKDKWWCSYQYFNDVPYMYSGASLDLRKEFKNESYGYYEARIKIPNQYSAWTAFWTFRASPGQGAGEVDIFETINDDRQGTKYLTPDVIKTNIHYNYCNSGSGNNNQGFCDGNNSGELCPGVPCADLNIYGYDYTQWHTYGLDLTPDKIIWYIDGTAVRIEQNTHIHNDSLTLKLGIAATPGYARPYITYNFDVTMDIDYIKFYKINQSSCTDVVNDCNFYFGGYQPTVKKSITIGANGCSNIQPVGTSKIMRATDFIQLNGHFEVPLGSELYLDVNDCY